MKRLGLLIIATALTLSGCAGSRSPLALDGTSWTVTEIERTATVSAQPPTVDFTHTRITGTTGCNRYSAAYTTDRQALSVSPLAATRMACSPPEIMSQETRFTIALGKVATFSGDATTIHLFDASNTEVLTLRAPARNTPSVSASLVSVTGDAVATAQKNAFILTLSSVSTWKISDEHLHLPALDGSRLELQTP